MAAGLPWFRVDSDIGSNPKVLQLVSDHGQRGAAAAFVFVCSLGYCAAHNTDGLIPRASLPFLHGSPVLARLLVEAGLWGQAEDGWMVTKYAGHQPTKAVRDADAAARSEAARNAANVRWGNV